jgi:TatD DNase family protein
VNRPPRWIDGHCHLADPALAPHLEEILGGAEQFIQGGVSPDEWQAQQELARRYPGRIHLSFGLHPWWVADHGGETALLEEGLALLKRSLPLARALGEAGLDFGKRTSSSTYEVQKKICRGQLELLRETPRPLVLHVVKAHAEALEILDEFQGVLKGGIVHAFGGSSEIAQRYIALGFAVSIGGGVLKKGFETLKRAVVRIAPEHLVIETDLDASSFPLTLEAVAEEVARLRGESSSVLLERSRVNLVRIFKL